MPPTQSHTAAILHGAKNLSVETIETPVLGPKEAQISPRATGICGTDLHYYQNGRNGIYQIRNSLVLGHEASGVIVGVGSDVSNLKVGDRVAVEPQFACRVCKHCSSGRYNLCSSMRFNGSASAHPPAQGSLQKRWNHPASLCYKLPDNVSFIEGAMVEPLSVAIHSVRKGGVQPGQTVLITGAGAIGLLCAQLARVSGAATILMVDVDEARLDFAKRHKLADQVFKIPFSGREGESNDDFAARMSGHVRDLLGADEADVALECTGVESCLNVCVRSVSAGSKIIMVGMGQPVQQVNVGVVLTREIELIGVWRYTNTFGPAIKLIEAGIVDVKSLVTHQYRMEEVVDALEFALSRPKDLVKCIITSTDV